MSDLTSVMGTKFVNFVPNYNKSAYDNYERMRLEQGWIPLHIRNYENRPDIAEINTWLETEVGEEVDTSTWDEFVDGRWEYLGANDFLIKDHKLATYMKLKWG